MKMPTKKQLDEQTKRQREIVRFSQGIPKTGRKVRYMGKYFYIFPNVFIPTWDTIPLFKNWKIKKGATILDVGTGSGIIAIMAKYKGAGKVVAIDINPAAIKTVKYNVEFHKFRNDIKVIKSDLFNNLNKKEKFDIIIANLPWRDLHPKNIVEKAMWDENLKFNKRFFNEVNQFLKPRGKIYFLQANFGEIKEIKKLIKKHGFVIKKSFQEKDRWRIFYTFELMKMIDGNY